MSASSPVPAGPSRNFWWILVPFAVGLAYAGVHLAWYRTTPLGQVPVLDEQENLAFADAIARGGLPHEPFYRAPGYALLLALLRVLGVPAFGLFQAALALGVALHALNAALVARIARVWFGPAAAVAAGLLYALHPVLVHYATQALDAVPALTFFLLGLNSIAPLLTRSSTENSSARPWLGASIAWAIATLCRPNYLLVWCTLPLLAFWIARPRQLRSVAALTGVVVFALTAAWQWRMSGVASFLPWQGPYNLWAANAPGTHGRYYVQHHALPAAVAMQNPARGESIFLFHEETGRAPRDIADLNAHWQRRFFDYVSHHPLQWLGLLARKAYALANNWEQYNNKTFAFHAARSPWLRWNPLGWGVLLLLGVAGFARLRAETPQLAPPLAIIAAACVASVILFFVSARFRLPLAALSVILGGGALAAPRFWQTWPRDRQFALGLGLAVVAFVTFSNFDGVNDRHTFVQDHALLARAASTVGDDALAWREALAALSIQPKHPDALRIAVATYFNQLVLGQADPAAEPQWHEVCARFLTEPASDAPDLRAVAAVALWRAKATEAALSEWRGLGATPSAFAARMLVGDLAPQHVDFSLWRDATWDEPLVRLAALRCKIPPPAGIALGDPIAAQELARRLFGPRS